MDTILSKTNISFLLFLIVNFLFAVKYTERITPFYLVISIGIITFYCSIWKYRMKLNSFQSKLNIVNFSVVLLFFLGSVFVFSKVPQESLMVDRWSVISSFWDNYFSDEYVYLATSHRGNYPGPMPFYYILALPFYLLGELGYFSLLGIIVFLSLLKFDKISVSNQTIAVILLCSSIFFLWEVISRSNVFLNGSLVLFSIIFLLKSIDKKTSYFVVCNGILIGLMLSTRNVFVIPYIITFLYILKYKTISIKEVFYIGIITILTFVSTFIPFIYNHIEEFKIMNPFIIQSDYLMPQYLTVICVIVSSLFVFLVKSKEDVYFYSGIALFMTISIYFVYHLIHSGFTESFFNSRVDISYFILSMPFLMCYFLKTSYLQRTDIT